VGDFNNNGSLDVIVTQLGGPPILLRNAGSKLRQNHWIAIKTIGTRSNRDGLGARIEINAGGHSQVQEVRANSSFLSASDPRTHFGLGAATQVDSISIHWPAGTVDTIRQQMAGQILVVKEGLGVINQIPAAGAVPRRHKERSGSNKRE